MWVGQAWVRPRYAHSGRASHRFNAQQTSEFLQQAFVQEQPAEEDEVCHQVGTHKTRRKGRRWGPLGERPSEFGIRHRPPPVLSIAREPFV